MNVKHRQSRKAALAWLSIFALLSLISTSAGAQEDHFISRLGEYQGYSQPIYDEYKRISRYVTVRDGTKLALDIFRPVQNGQVVSDPLPVIWTHHRYHRADVQGDQLRTVLDGAPWLKAVLQHGYVVAAADVRGGGASYGTRGGEFTPEEALDAYDITEWFAAQSWCNGRVGMYGGSYLGITQYLAAAQAPPHLVAIFPEVAMFDLYSTGYPGGVPRYPMGTTWNQMVKDLDQVAPAAPVDGDWNREMLTKATQEHQANRYIFADFLDWPYRDSQDAETGTRPYFVLNPSSYLSQLQESGVAIYHLGGWFDCWPRDTFVWFSNLDNPQKLIVGPWPHSGRRDFDLAAEHLRWYDYWLKGIDNGIMDEAPIHYYAMGAPEGKAWRAAWQWPLPNKEPTRYYFDNGPSGSASSSNDGLLSTQFPTATTGYDEYAVNYTATSGTSTRWANAIGESLFYPDMSQNDRKGLTYTTPPLSSDLEMTGHPVVHLWVSSTSTDGDFFVYLEDVDERGYSHYVTEGSIRASHRATSLPPFEYMGLPYHPGLAQDVQALPLDEPVELVFDLYPTSQIFKKGDRIRVTVTGADKDNYMTPQLSPPPTVSVYRSADYASYITLPIIPQQSTISPPSSLPVTGGSHHTSEPLRPGDPPGPSKASEAVWLIVTVLLLAIALTIKQKYTDRS